MKNFIIKMMIILVVVGGLFISFKVYGATDPTLVTKINSALKKIQGYLVKVAPAAAGVAIAAGVLIRKFSFGDEEKMKIGKKIIINAIIGYTVILLLDTIIKFVEAMV